MLHHRLPGNIPGTVLGLFARDGVTDMSGNWNSFAKEWQINGSDPKLFKDQKRFPQ